MSRNYCVFILTHGRADRVITLDTLKKQGYSGNWMLVCDDEDKQLDDYISRFGEDKIAVFSKDEIEKRFDTMDTSKDRRTIVYARNACYDIAEKYGYDYFIELDDDYTSIEHRYIDGEKMREKKAAKVAELFECMFSFLDDSGAKVVALAQGGDFIGGKNGTFFQKRPCEKSDELLFCNTKKTLLVVWQSKRRCECIHTLWPTRRTPIYVYESADNAGKYTGEQRRND